MVFKSVDIRRSFSEAKSIGELDQKVVEAAKPLPVTHIHCGQVLGAGGVPEATEEFGYFNRAWMATYMEERLFFPDPTVIYAANTIRGFTFKEATDAVEMNDANWNVMNRAKEFGINQGFVVPLRGINGEFSLFTAAGKDFPEELTTEERGLLTIIAIEGKARADEIRVHNDPWKFKNPLTPRQKEAFQNMARGLRADRIAEQMGISVKQTNDHLAQARKALHVRTNPAALMKAVMRGYIETN